MCGLGHGSGMTDDDGPRLEVFSLFNGRDDFSLWLPVARARRVQTIEVRPARPRVGPIGPDEGEWLPLRVAEIDPSDGATEVSELLSFLWANPLADMVAGRQRWDSVPPMPLPDEGWNDLDEGWWLWLVVHDGWVFGAQTDFDRADEALQAGETLTWSAPGQACLGRVPVSWVAVPRSAWDEAWELAVRRLRAGPS